MNRLYLQRSSRTLPGISRRLVSIVRTRSRRSASRLQAAGTVEKHRGAGPRTLEPSAQTPRLGRGEGRSPGVTPPLRERPNVKLGTRACARFANETFVYWSVGSNRSSRCSVPAHKTNFPPLTECTRGVFAPACLVRCLLMEVFELLF